MKFSVGVESFNEDVNIGVVPGVFDAKQLVLCALAVLIHNSEHKYVRFVRTLDKEQLAICNRFITDGFAKKFPQIPSYNNVGKVWKQYGRVIIQSMYGNFADYNVARDYAEADICKFENFDILTQYNAYVLGNGRTENESFNCAIEKAYELLLAIIDSAVNRARSMYTVDAYLEKAEENILYLPFNINYSGIKMNQIDWVIVKEEDGIYRVDNLSEELDLRQCIDQKLDVIYSGRFFAKVTNYDVALELIDSVENNISIKHANLFKDKKIS